jgi:hypothetical protein
LVRWASGKINALLITATLVSLWNFASFGASEATLSCVRAKHSSDFEQSNYIILRDSCKTTISLSLKYVRLLTFGQLHEYAARATLKRGIPNGASLLDEEDNNNA